MGGGSYHPFFPRGYTGVFVYLFRVPPFPLPPVVCPSPPYPRGVLFSFMAEVVTVNIKCSLVAVITRFMVACIFFPSELTGQEGMECGGEGYGEFLFYARNCENVCSNCSAALTCSICSCYILAGVQRGGITR